MAAKLDQFCQTHSSELFLQLQFLSAYIVHVVFIHAMWVLDRCNHCIGCSTRVANEIGAGNVDRARNAVSVTMKLSVFLAISFVLLLGFGHNLWVSLFSRSSTIAS